jgi:hypothetical protein
MASPDIAVTVRATPPRRRTGEPVTCGVPFPRGLIRDAGALRLIDADGQEQTLQARILDRWGDGSARWVLCDWRATVNESTTYRIRLAETPIRTTHEPTGRPVAEDEARRVIQGSSQFIPSDVLRLYSEDQKYDPFPDFDWFIEEMGPARISILERGTLTHEGVHIARYALRQHHFVNTGVVRVHLTIHNPNCAEHPGGLWDLGDPGSIWIQDCSIRMRIGGSGPLSGRVSVEPGAPFTAFEQDIHIDQDSSGGENWQSRNHVCWTREVPNKFRGYKLVLDGRETPGLRATPIIVLQRGDAEIALSVPYFWQNFPKTIDVDDDGIVLGLFPRDYAVPHELQGGEQKEHVFYVAHGRDTITENPLEWTRDPLVAVVDPEWVASTGAIPYFTSRANDPHREYRALVDAAIEGDDTFEKKREIIDEYGWRHFGDIYGDHEGVLHAEVGPKPRISHYNNQYDAIAGFAIHWLRSGDVRWFRQMNELAFHVRDIDIYNTDEDKAAYNHGLFWHTYHYVDADTSTHRSYPKNGRVPQSNSHAPREDDATRSVKTTMVPGGGPASEQNYAHGLMLHYFLTGDEASKEAAIGLARWVIDMDDGRKTVFGWLSRSDTGLASASRSPDYQGPGRGAANSVSALIDGHRLTGDPMFLRKAEQLIRRVIHPGDDVTQLIGMVRDGRVYVDAENRWFYTMFLQSLGKYLDYKAERDEIDEHYAYARACLLHYARWMAEHEYPYLERPEILEYPTETWAAQDMRKSEIFDIAALHADDTERPRFRERAEYFFRQSVESLTNLPTRTLCRPVVLMLTNGWRRAWFAANPRESRPAPAKPATDFGPRVRFVPQKVIALRRAKMLAVAGAGLAFAGLIGLIAWLVT